MNLLRLGVDLLLEGDAELRAEGLELIKVLLVLGLVLDLGLDSCLGGGGMLAFLGFFLRRVSSCFGLVCSVVRV